VRVRCLFDSFQQDEFFRSVFDAVPALAFIVDEDVRLLTWNAMADHDLALDAGHAFMQRGGEALHCINSTSAAEGCGRAEACSQCVIRNSVNQAFDGKRISRELARLELSAEGQTQEVYFLVTAAPFGYQGKDYVLLIMEDVVKLVTLEQMNRQLSQEITERRHAEERQRESEAFIRDILETVDEGFIVIDRDYRIVTANRAYAEQVGLPKDKIIGSHCYEISHHSDRRCYEKGEECAIQRAFEDGKSHTVVHSHCREGKTCIHVETKSFPMRDKDGEINQAIEVFSDLTEKKRLQEQLLQSQKMEAIGALTSGIAHDFNNVLTAIMGCSEILHDEIPKESHLALYANMIYSSAERAASLTQSLLTFSRKKPTVLKEVDINEAIRTFTGILKRLLGDDVWLVTKLAPGELTVMADRTQLEQVLMNLAVNARDAMPNGGVLSIITETRMVDDAYIKALGHGCPGPHAVISVSDEGIGMDEKTKERIFEPFFTTKEEGKGTGLGLAVVYGIVRQHKGHIEVYSKPAMGTTFKIFIPAVVCSDKKTEDSSQAFDASAGREAGKETILLAEDDETTRKFIKLTLERAGYKVIATTDGGEAVTAFRENKDRIQLLLLDLVMAGLDGKRAYEEIQKIQPDIKALMMSGYPLELLDEKDLLKDGMGFIAKPVSPKELLKKVREELDRQS